MGRKQKRKPFPLKAVLLYVSLCTFVIVGVTFSKYIVASDGGDSARVVKFNEISISETGDFIASGGDKGKFMMTPGVEIKKDAVVSFGGAETAAYIFLEVNPQNWEKGGTDMDFLAGKDVGKVHFSICDEWTFLEAKDGKYVYYIALEPNNTLSQQIIRDGKVFVDWNIRNSELQKLNDLALTFKATAVQTDGRTPEEMWALING